MAKHILIKPVITEKADALSENSNKYTFVVNKKANKIEIGKAVADMYNVEVKSVNTMVMPAKAKNRNTRRGIIRGRVSSYKKAVVTLADGETINFFGDL
ncbi:MAG: 50S ribosomal protein L23 [Saprospiraceae bacterium]|mgnify:CR=1 FL=1|nr:50S ribosomal protein L23 [Saprospirales bacterium]RMD97761.1 MAG: 50S ribosomal protein L23 [Bacteroidota bacterium]